MARAQHLRKAQAITGRVPALVMARADEDRGSFSVIQFCTRSDSLRATTSANSPNHSTVSRFNQPPR